MLLDVDIWIRPVVNIPYVHIILYGVLLDLEVFLAVLRSLRNYNSRHIQLRINDLHRFQRLFPDVAH